MKFSSILPALLMLTGLASGKGLNPIELTDVWKAKNRDLAPAKAMVEPAKPRKVLVFSLATGYVHWCIPHTDTVVGILGDKTGAYTCVFSTDIEQFRAANLAQYDAVVLNNNCPDRKDRDLFRDVLVNKMEEHGKKYSGMSREEREQLAGALYRDLVDYVAGGGGLVLLHGAITIFNNSEEFSGLVGGSFDFHPPQQEVTLHPVAPKHPMLDAFNGQAFVHIDEPYFMKGAYADFSFRPLLELDMDKLVPSKKLQTLESLPRYVSWIKPYKKGRVFFCSPSHNAHSFEKPELLAFILSGMQYAVGDLKCDDTLEMEAGRPKAQ